MTKTKKWLIFGGTGLLLAAVIIILGLRYLPWHKLMKRPTSEDIAFVNNTQGPGSGPFSLSLDFEVDPGAGIPDDIYQGTAHSGSFSTKTFGKNTFSVMFEKTVKDLGFPDMKAVALSAWVYVFPSSAEPEGSLVFSITNTVGVNTCWKGVSLHGPHVPRGEWFKISGSFNLSDVQIRPDDKIQIYFWNNSDTKILSDDFYVVFGTQAPRRGDSAIVDMTRNGYTARLNTPPFPVRILYRQELENGNEASIDLTPNDQIVAGRFAGFPDGLESVFAVGPDGTPSLFHYCAASGFQKIPVNLSVVKVGDLAGTTLHKGSFTAAGSDQLLFVGEKGIILAELEGGNGRCGKETGNVEMKAIWSSEEASVGGIPYRRPGFVVPCDVNGDRITELLVVTDRGSWNLFRFQQGGWVRVVSGEENRIGEWDDKYADFTIAAGLFMHGTQADQLLTVFTEKEKKRYSYSLLRFNPAEKKFVKALAGNERAVGMTVGLDTLKPGDRFFFGSFAGIPGGGFLRYSRDWRFDLKVTGFNDSTFVIRENVDFTGFDKDYNPKFYEALRLVAGRLVHPSETSFLVIARNCKDRDFRGGVCREWDDLPYLPNCVRIYSFTTNKQEP